MKRLGIALLAGALSLPFAFAAQKSGTTPASQSDTTTTKAPKKKASKKSSKKKNKTNSAKPAEPTAK